MSIHFHKLRIKEIKKETPDCVSLAFYVPDELKEAFSFSQGQNVTLRATINGEDIRRSYSICMAPYEKELRVAVKKAEFGIFSRYVNESLQAGDELDILPPTGKFFTPLDPNHKKNYVAFAAGSGITPIISIIKTTLQTEPHSNFTLIYGNQNLSSVIFLEELEGLKNLYPDRFALTYIFSREKTDIPIFSGRITKEKLEGLSKLVNYNNTDEFFICGPEAMIFCVKDYLLQYNIDPKKIHFELFTTPDTKKKEQDNFQSKMPSGAKQGTVAKSHITVKLDGRSYDFELDRDGDTILNAALKLGTDLPFACKGGVCSTCRAKLVEGKVEMDANWALEPEEVENGYILTCQSHPVTERLVVDFDVK
jgi:ring-1,2-phenylacetyl-CoA epoxidase subunit PaaE